MTDQISTILELFHLTKNHLKKIRQIKSIKDSCILDTLIVHGLVPGHAPHELHGHNLVPVKACWLGWFRNSRERERQTSHFHDYARTKPREISKYE